MKTIKFVIMLLFFIFLSFLVTGCLETSLEIIPEMLSLPVEQTQEFTVVVKGMAGRFIDIKPSWLVTGGIGTVSPTEGNKVTFKATNSGSGTIKVTAGGITATSEITVDSILAMLDLMPAPDILLDVGQTQEFTVVGTDVNDKIIDIEPSWAITGEVGTVSSTEGKTVIFEAVNYGFGFIKVTAEHITVTTRIDVTLTEARVNSFMETFQELYNNEDAEGVGELYCDLITVINSDNTSEEVTRENMISTLDGAFNESELTLFDWDITIDENVATVTASINVKTGTYAGISKVEFTVKNFEGDLFIFVLKDLSEG